MIGLAGIPLVQQTVLPSQTRLFGVHMVGLTADSGRKLLLSLGLIVLLFLIGAGARWLFGLLFRGEQHARAAFWGRQATRLVTFVILVLGLLSIWFESPARLGTMVGLVTAGIAVALQRVITSFAAYLIILRGKTFTVGDRIMMGGVRGDVISLGFMQTTVMEMGQPPGEQGDAPSMWVEARQYTGRLVRVTNDKIFDTPVYNYTRDFPYIWEEMHVPIGYTTDRHRAEDIMLDVARRHTTKIAEMSESDLREMERRSALERAQLGPRVYLRITDNWVELALRFVAHERGVRDLKDAMSREMLAEFQKAGIEIASATYDVVGMPTLRVQQIPS